MNNSERINQLIVWADDATERIGSIESLNCSWYRTISQDQLYLLREGVTNLRTSSPDAKRFYGKHLTWAKRSKGR